MDGELKVLIPAIVLILMILLGTFALSGPESTAPGAPGPSATYAVTPFPSPFAAPVPTAMPESGVRQTEFGYWVTYPTLGPQVLACP